jgi:eukaryotic-like serine/threonine-protein kinase
VKRGEIIRGYTIIADPTNSGGGRCVWSFAERSGTPYFIKQFLDPKWPTAESMGSPASKERRRAACLEFEHRHQSVNGRINGRVAGGGNLVTATEFFREGTTYYKVTDRVAAEAAKDLRDLTDRQTAVVLRTLCHSMRLLHRAGIVHGDLKPANVLLQRSDTADLVTAKMIDFDDSYLSGDPPPPDQIVGDQKYGAPEWLRYVKQDPDVDKTSLTTAADIFALGLMFHVYLVGELPQYDRGHFESPAEAVWAGEPLVLSMQLHPQTRETIRRMTSAALSERPTVDDLIKLLQDENLVRVGGSASALRTTATSVPGRSRVRTNMSDGREPPAPPPPRRPDGTSRIRMHFER